MTDITRTIEIEVLTKDAVKGIDNLNESLDENQKETEQSTDKAKKYEKQLDNTGKEAKLFGDQLDNMTGGFVSMLRGIRDSIKGLKLLKIAFVATGLGAIAVIIGTISAAFTKLQGPMSLIEDTLAGIDAAFNQALKSLDLFGKAFVLFLEGNMIAALGVAGAALNDIGKAFQEGSELSKGQREFNLRQAETLLLLSKQERQIEQLKLVAEDQTKTQTVRIEAANKAFELQTARVNTLIQLERDRANLAREQRDISAENDQDKIDFLNLQTQSNEQIATLEGQLVELNNSRNAILKEMATSQAKIVIETGKFNDAITEEIDLEDQLNKQLEDQIDLENELSNIKKTNVEQTDEEIEKQTDLSTAIGTTADAATGLLDIFQGKVKGKDIFKTVLKTLTGVLSIILPGSGAAIGGVAGLIGGLFADGGYTGRGGKYEPAGIVHKGEYVVPQKVLNSSFGSELVNQLESMRTGLKGYSDGGFVAGLTAQEAQISQLNQTLSEQRIVLPIEDLRTVNTRVTTIEDRATL